MKLKIGHLYGDLMNIYGDNGNIIALKKRCEWRGIEVEVVNISIRDRLKPGDFDLFFFGGGQDESQGLVAKDLGASLKGETIKKEVERGVPLLSICGGYQLLGEYYQPFTGEKLMGVGLFSAYTKASNDRMIGNLVIELSVISYQPSIISYQTSDSLTTESESAGRRTSGLKTDNYLIGFENHSGKTYLKKDAQALGKVTRGFGNNGEDKTEGCIYKNAIGCYMHGSLLPKNPLLADWLIKKALEVKYGEEVELEKLDDRLETTALEAALKKFG